MKYKGLIRYDVDGHCDVCSSVHVVESAYRDVPNQYGDGHLEQRCAYHRFTEDELSE